MARAKKVASKKLGGPFLTTAMICDTILEGKDGVTSYIRIIDTFNLTGESPKMLTGLLEFKMVIGFKNGDAKGEKEMTVACIAPSGKVAYTASHELNFSGPSHGGPSLRITVAFAIHEPGLYWFDVKLENKLVTKIPLQINYRQIASLSQKSTSSQ